MAANPRLATIRAANRTTRELRVLFGRLGSKEHPRGHVLTAYRNSRRALGAVLRRSSGAAALPAAREVLEGMRFAVEGAARSTLEDAIALGVGQAHADVGAWGLAEVGATRTPIYEALGSWMGIVDQQVNEALAVIAMDGDTALILGDATRQGLLRPLPVINTGRRWVTTMAVLSYVESLEAATRGTGETWGKQAVPAIDKDTTDCCLQVARSGQVVALNKKFKLTGTPRYADEMEWSPFHWGCRTSITLVPMRLAQDDLTRALVADARRQLRANEKK